VLPGHCQCRCNLFVVRKLIFRLSHLVLWCVVFAGRGDCATANSTQRLLCNTGYRVPECLQQLAVLRAALDRYHAESLGPWTWVIVKSEDWKPIVRGHGGNTDSPAFTVSEKRETFLEEALFVPVAQRSAELLTAWSVPLNEFLDLAVTHEMGHGICHDRNEARAVQFSMLLRQGKEAKCAGTNDQKHRRGAIRRQTN
jgi:hypothetical protein